MQPRLPQLCCLQRQLRLRLRRRLRVRLRVKLWLGPRLWLWVRLWLRLQFQLRTRIYIGIFICHLHFPISIFHFGPLGRGLSTIARISFAFRMRGKFRSLWNLFANFVTCVQLAQVENFSLETWRMHPPTRLPFPISIYQAQYSVPFPFAIRPRSHPTCHATITLVFSVNENFIRHKGKVFLFLSFAIPPPPSSVSSAVYVYNLVATKSQRFIWSYQTILWSGLMLTTNYFI